MSSLVEPVSAYQFLHREWRVILALLPGLLVLMLNATLLNLPMVEVTNALASDRYRVLWITCGYGVAYTFGCMLTGLVRGQVGLSCCFWGSLLSFGLLGTLSGTTESVALMTPLRIAQGLCKGLALTSSMQILWGRFPDRIPLWMGVYGTIAFAGALLGAPFGGLVLHWLSWRWLFLLELPLGGFAALVAWLLLADDRPAVREKLRADVIGIILTLGWLICLLVVAAMGHYWGWLDSPAFVLWLFGFVLFFLAFLVWGAVLSAPAIPTVTLGLPRYVITLIILDIYGINLYATLSLLSGYMLDQRGYQWWQASLILLPVLPPMVLTVFLTLYWGTAADRRWRLFAGLAVMVLADWWLSTVDLYTPGHWLVVGLIIWGVGVGLATVPAMAGLFDGLSTRQVFTQTGIFNLNRFAPPTVAGLLLSALLARATDTQLDRLRLAVTQNRPAVSETVRHLESELHERSSRTNGAMAQARAALGKWVRLNARTFALQTVLKYLALFTAFALVLTLVMPRPGQPAGQEPPHPPRVV